jgi:hypothetical protein
VKPSGPRALVEPISKKAVKISCSVGISQIETFSLGEIQLSKRDKRSSSKLGPEELKAVLKYDVKQLPIYCRSEDQTPAGSLKKSIAFLILLIIVEVW